MADLIAVTDLPSSLQSAPGVELMLAGANGVAARVAPCLVSTDPAPSQAQLDEAKLVLLGAVTRWTQQGAGGIQQQTAGPFTMGTIQQQATGYRLWPSEIAQLQEICSGDARPTIGSIDTAPSLAGWDFSPGSDFFFGPS